MIADEPDKPVRIRARVRLAGEPLTKPAREFGYADASGVHQVISRVDLTARSDRDLGRRLDELKDAIVSNMER